LLTARSKNTGEDEPMAWAYTYGKGKVFQTVLGHDVKSLSSPEVQKLLNQGSLWIIDKLE
jgi:type 1 glutamine amidotransferase